MECKEFKGHVLYKRDLRGKSHKFITSRYSQWSSVEMAYNVDIGELIVSKYVAELINN